MEKKNVVFLTVLAVATLLTAVVGTTFAYFTATVTNTNTPTASSITTADKLGITYDDGTTINGALIKPGWAKSKTITVTNTGNVDLDFTIGFDSTATYTNDFVAGKGAAWWAAYDPSTQTSTGSATNTNDFVYTITKKVGSGSVADYITASSAVLVDNATATDNTTTPVTTYTAAATGSTINTYKALAVPASASTIISDTVAANTTNEYVLTIYFLETNVKQDENNDKTFTGTLKAQIVNAPAGVQVQ